MKKDFITVSPDNGGTTQVSVVADPNSTFQSRSTTLNFSAGGGVSRAITVNQDGIPLMPVVGLTSTGAFPCFLQFLFRLRLRFNPYVGDRARKKRKINIRGVLIELLGFHV